MQKKIDSVIKNIEENLSKEQQTLITIDTTSLKELTDLERLYLSSTQITDAGLEYLNGLTGLRKLDLRFTQVTDAGANELSKTLPNCRIYR